MLSKGQFRQIELVVVWFMCLVHLSSENWMYLGLVGANAPSKDRPCLTLPGLVTQQIQVCETNPSTIQSVSEGAKRAILECQSQFRNERWNCTTKKAEHNVFGLTLERGSRETAFIYAVTSAGVTHAITQACSSGNLTDCSCDVKTGKTPQGWKWGGCSDNVRYGVQFGRQFVDAPERSKGGGSIFGEWERGRGAKVKEGKSQRNARHAMNLHNNEAGRQAIAQLMRVQCRCHGVSGSCELKTCWNTLPQFSEVGEFLKKRYSESVMINPTRKRRDKSSTAKNQLIYIHRSPDYCVEDKRRGISGTSGRMCNKTSNGADSCEFLCCGRGYNTRVVRHAERCHCKFVWCCYVKCKTCETMVEVHTCK